MVSMVNSGAVLAACFEAGRVVICPAGARNGSAAETRAMLEAFGYEAAGRRYAECVPGLPEATVVLVNCLDMDAPIDPQPVALVGIETFTMLAAQASDEAHRAALMDTIRPQQPATPVRRVALV